MYCNGFALLYYFVEKQLNHQDGSFASIQDMLKGIKDLYNYDFENLHYQLIRTMMSDLRLRNLSEEADISCDNFDSKLKQADSKLDLACMLLLKDTRPDLAAQILEDLYFG